jgi:protein-tyrosine phosphatase
LRVVLFLCTGNYFRSRFAELLFNHLAQAEQLDWRAVSAGLEHECWTRNPGPISAFTRAGLQERGVPLVDPPLPRDVTAEHLEQANLIIAVKEHEHRPMLAERFPTWVDRVRYWQVDDIPLVPGPHALAELDLLVRALIADLRTE